MTSVPGADEGPGSGGLRSRKKQKTRRAIEDAALELFAEQGYESTTVDQIAARAEVSKATFFNYFATKGEVVFGDNADHYQQLRQAIIDRPPAEDDITAVRLAIRDDWRYTLDPERTARQARAAGSSPLLRGMSFDLALRWQGAIADALARRHELDEPDRRCRLMAATVFAVLSNGVNAWLEDGCSSDLGAVVDQGFEILGRFGTEFVSQAKRTNVADAHQPRASR